MKRMLLAELRWPRSRWAMLRPGMAAQTAPVAAATGAPFRTTCCSPNGPDPMTACPPWDKVTPELFPEAFQFGDRRAAARGAGDRQQPGAADLRQHHRSAREGRPAARAASHSLFGVMTSNLTTPAYQALDKEWSPKLSAASDEITLNPQLFQRIKAVYEARASLARRQAAAARHPSLRERSSATAPTSTRSRKSS